MRNLNIILMICVCILVHSCKENKISTMVESMTGQTFKFNEADCLILHKGDIVPYAQLRPRKEERSAGHNTAPHG